MKKRYAVELDLYVYADTEEGALREARFYKEHNRLVEDNNAEILSVTESPFGTIGTGKQLREENEKMTYEELNILQKYCDNRMDFKQFKEALIYITDDEYGLEAWKKFVENPIRFITTRSDKDLFYYIKQEILKTNYKG